MKIEGKQIGALVALILGVVLAFLPVRSRQITINPDALGQAIVNSGDRIDPNTVSQWIVEGNSDLLLIDVRSPEEYQQGHIKTAVNIPLTELIKYQTIEQLDPNKYLVLYSNGISHASQAWVVLKSSKLNNTMILEGGLNYWNKVILNPEKPGEFASNDEVLVYKAKKAVANSLGGGGGTIDNQSEVSEPETPMPLNNNPKRKKRASGGC